jgi:hypothetical protein
MSPRTPINAVAYARTAIGLVAQSTPPASPSIGAMYFDTDDNLLYTFDGTVWNAIGVNTVTSVFGRTGSITAVAGDYAA